MMNMKKIICLALTVLLVVSALAGCTNASANNIFDKDNKDISVGVGQTFTIQLEENPTTGYGWSLTISDENVLKLDDDIF
ncbi:MAG TPA: protease inhibitor I42 family protein, partial [Clostridia bacterium]|nr:protease inhibitor I42 family protein [Clostridia bacterium]